MSLEEEFLGFVKYDGKRLESGAFDARKSAKALIGFDEALRHFILAQAPDLRDIEFEVPVRIEKGSWIASIPTDISTLFQLGLGIAATAYVTNAAKKMAEKDFDGVGFKDIFKTALEALKWIARIGKHLGNLDKRQFDDVKFKENNKLIGIPNESGEYLYLPVKYLELYAHCSPKILGKLAANIDTETTLSIGVLVDGKIDQEIITVHEKSIFSDEEEELTDELLFPELVHGATVSLTGEVTRENKTSQSMGFKYQGHILTAYPETRNIVPYKPMLFETCRLIGVVDRIDEKGRIGAKRPKLIFSSLEPVSGQNRDLFD
ncbi:hypothetical protein KTE49_04720 [Burkholderia multivorans]|uniref:hypothetical protein n=1 Tax=Burkholderia multivorans TaxID=87883 RepID=UPI000D00A7C4|nr:hypothetical protein [Burkholderia multivorans]MBJ9617661.1 hypothetical protein [Burkholderia multivorans]MBU9326591.1 hypothetical protein [Burkholderia multivorans]MBU9529756.1 hypothetical protein [Burkholderia multivorans]MDR8782421.1 hypothetical protein [Burkholderia multivorans]MDR8823414.1 hypothetical protein [Burkholderia multivorans]